MRRVAVNPLLQTGDGRLLAAAQFCDHFGIGLAFVALPWIVLDGGGGAALAGLVFAVGTLPYVLFGLLAGVTGDRRSRKRVMVAAHSLQMLFAAVVPLWALTGHPPVGLVLASAFAVGAGRTFADAASFGAVAELVGSTNFVRGQAVLSTGWAAGSILGPFLGGLLIAAFGAAAAVTAESALFAVAALLVWRIRRPLPAPSQEVGGRIRDAAREGIAVIMRTPLLRLLTSVQLLWYLCVIGALALIVPFLREELSLDARETGWILGAGAVTGVSAGFVVGVLERRFGGLRVIAASVAVSALAAGGLAGVPGFWTALVAYAVLDFSIWISVTALIGERQRLAPDHLQARVGITGRAIALGSMTVGSLVASGLAVVVPLRALYLGVGITALAIAVWAVPALLRHTGTAVALPEPRP